MALSLVDKAKQYFTSKSQDNEGWFRQGKFTPLQQIGSQINYQKQVSPINRALYTGIETAAKPIVNSLANIGAMGATALGSAQMALNKPQAAQKSFQTALNARNFAGTQGSFDQGTGLQTLKTGGLDALKTLLTAKGLKYTTPANLGLTGLIGGGLSKMSGGDFATGAGRAIGTTPQIMGAVAMSNPLLAKIMPTKASPIVSRLTGGLLNVAQGVGINASQGTPVTPASVGLDLATGLVGGRGQFNMGTNFSMSKKTIDEVVQAEDMLLHPERYLEQTISVNKKNANAIKKVQIKKIQEEAARIIDQISAKHLPNDILEKTAGNAKAQIKALIDLNSENKLTNVNYLTDKKSQPIKTGGEDLIKQKAIELYKQKNGDFRIVDGVSKAGTKIKILEGQNPDGTWFNWQQRGGDNAEKELKDIIDRALESRQDMSKIDSPTWIEESKRQLNINYGQQAKISEINQSKLKTQFNKEQYARRRYLTNPTEENAIKWKETREGVYEVPINSLKLNQTKQETYSIIGGSDKTRTPDKPLVVLVNNNGELVLQDGYHRYYDALEKGDKKVKVIFETPDDTNISKFIDNINQPSPIKTGEIKQPTIKIKGLSDSGKNTLPLNEKNTIQQPQVKSSISTQKSLSSSEDIIPPSVKLSESVQRVKRETAINSASAEVNKQTRQMFPESEIERINRVKKIARSKAFLEGDIETLRKLDKNGDVEKVVEQVRIVRPDIIDDAEALDYALSLPTKSSTVSKRPVLSQEEKNIRLETLKENKRFLEEQRQLDDEISGAMGDPRSIFKESGATLTKKQYETKKVATLKLQSENARKAQNEANDYFKSISTPAYKKGNVNLGDQLPADELLKAKKDKMAFAYQRETIQRNIEDIFGKDSKMKKYVVDNITNNENQSTNFQNTLRTKLATVFNKSSIKKGSKEDYAAADFIEGTLSLDQLKKQFPNKWQGIVKASEEGRAVYKDLLNKINTTLKRFGYEPIPERQNYVTHTNQIQTLSERIGSLTNLSSDELPRAMAGINLETKPGRKFFSFGLQRQGGSTHEGLITALDKYIPSASRQIFHTEDIQRGRAILSFLQKSADEGDTRLSGFTSYFSQFVDHLAGKQNIIDRPIEKIFGRKFLAVGDWVRKRTGANMVGANLSSAATNFIPFTQSAATTSKPAFARGLLESALNVGKEPSVIDGVQSGFLLRRFAKEKITGTLGENIKDIATLPFKLVDKFTSTSVVAGKYFEQLAKGLSKEKAMAMADDYAQRVMADRSFAQSPLLFSSKTLGALTQFQLEVNNQMSFLMKDIPKNLGYSKAQIASSLVQFAVFSYLFNNLYEKVVGRRPQIDPIQAGLTTAEGLQNGDGLQALNPLNQQGVGFSDKTGTGQILNQLPFTSVGGGRLPITTAITNPQYYLLPPFGGGQLKKTIEGLNTYNKGYSETKTGRVRFPIEKNTTNLVKSGLFGQYSTKEARDYFSKNNSILGEKQSELMKQSNDKIGLYKTIMSDRQQNSTIEKLKDKVKQTGESGTAGNKYIYYKDGEVKTIDLTFDDTSPKLTGNKELDKKKISTYSSSITRRINDIVELNEQGQMEDSKAEAEILRLLQLQKEAKAKTTKKSTKSKGGKITIAKVATPTVKKFKLPTIKLPNTSLKSNIKIKKPSIAQLKKRRTIKIKV